MRLAAQLYTLRDFTQTAAEFQNTLRNIRDIGYLDVQLSAIGCMSGPTPTVNARQCREMLDDAGLRAPLTHRGWDEITERTDECIAFHVEIGAELVAVGSIPGSYRADGLDGYRRFVDDAEPAIEQLGRAGLAFAYHNHAFEFERMGAIGERPFDVMRDRGSAGFGFEIDTYWVVHAGIDLLSVISRLRGRMPMVHWKDKVPVGNEVRMAPVGEGNMDWPSILSACKEAGTTLGAVEQDDCYGRDPFDCLASSYRFLSTLKPMS